MVSDFGADCNIPAFTGDPAYLPWLIQQMDDPKLSRSAGEAFALVTGLDLSFLDLDRTPPEDPESSRHLR